MGGGRREGNGECAPFVYMGHLQGAAGCYGGPRSRHVPNGVANGPPGYEQNGTKRCPLPTQASEPVDSDRRKKWRLRFVEPASGKWQWQVGSGNGRLWKQDEGGGEKDDMDQDQRQVNKDVNEAAYHGI